MDKKTLVVGILIGIAIMGCIAAVSGDDEWVPVMEGRTYKFHGIGMGSWSHSTSGEVIEVLPNGWVLCSDNWYMNMRLVDCVQDVTPQ